jgi:hypothetical protein
MEPFTVLALLNLFPFCSLCSTSSPSAPFVPLCLFRLTYLPSHSASFPRCLSQPLSATSVPTPPSFTDSVCSLCSPLPLSVSFCSYCPLALALDSLLLPSVFPSVPLSTSASSLAPCLSQPSFAPSVLVMSTILKRKYKRSDIIANYRNETKTF